MHSRCIASEAVGAVGLGAMPLSVEGRPPREHAVATVRAALDAGVTLIDTADSYCLGPDETGHNERVVAGALAELGVDDGRVLVATKGGHYRTAGGGWAVCGRPDYLERACEASLRALGTDVIDLYQFHRPDPAVPFAESVGALAGLREAGKVRLVGLSNVSTAQIDEARDIVPVASVQNQFSPTFRSSLGELRHCAALGIAFLAWAPLGGATAAGAVGDRHRRFAEVAARYGVSAQRLVLAWELAQADVVIPIPGARRPETIRDSAAAADLVLDRADLELLDSA